MSPPVGQLWAIALLNLVFLIGVAFVFDGWLGVVVTPNAFTLRAGMVLMAICALAIWQRHGRPLFYEDSVPAPGMALPKESRSPASLLRPVMRYVLREEPGQPFCRACLWSAMVKVAGDRWSRQDVTSIVEAVFDAPGAFETLHHSCSVCGKKGVQVILGPVEG